MRACLPSSQRRVPVSSGSLSPRSRPAERAAPPHWPSPPAAPAGAISSPRPHTETRRAPRPPAAPPPSATAGAAGGDPRHLRRPCPRRPAPLPQARLRRLGAGPPVARRHRERPIPGRLRLRRDRQPGRQPRPPGRQCRPRCPMGRLARLARRLRPHTPNLGFVAGPGSQGRLSLLTSDEPNNAGEATGMVVWFPDAGIPGAQGQYFDDQQPGCSHLRDCPIRASGSPVSSRVLGDAHYSTSPSRASPRRSRQPPSSPPPPAPPSAPSPRRPSPSSKASCSPPPAAARSASASPTTSPTAPRPGSRSSVVQDALSDPEVLGGIRCDRTPTSSRSTPPPPRRAPGSPGSASPSRPPTSAPSTSSSSTATATPWPSTSPPSPARSESPSPSRPSATAPSSPPPGEDGAGGRLLDVRVLTEEAETLGQITLTPDPGYLMDASVQLLASPAGDRLLVAWAESPATAGIRRVRIARLACAGGL